MANNTKQIQDSFFSEDATWDMDSNDSLFSAFLQPEATPGGWSGTGIDGDDGDNTLNGGPGNQLIYGKGGNDLLDGEANDDHLWGGAGNDTLYGGTGEDKL